VLSPLALDAIDPTHAPLDSGQLAALAGLATLAGGGLAALAGVNVQGAATAAQNEALNNSADHWEKPGQQNEGEKFTVSLTPQGAPIDEEQAQQGGGGTDTEGVTVGSSSLVAGDAAGATNTSSALQQVQNLFSTNAPGAIQIGGSTFAELPNTGNAAMFSGATQAQVQQFFLDLSGATELPTPIMVPGKGPIYVVNTPSGNFMLRDFSTSSGQTGPTWTIDVPQGAVGKTYNPEIKFLK
jgi:filamentous hemagglutinin